MRRSILTLVALMWVGCAEEEVQLRRPSPLVQLAAVDPGTACRAVDMIEVRSGAGDESAESTLRAYAAAHGANYVAVDQFSVCGEDDRTETITRARLYACPDARTASMY